MSWSGYFAIGDTTEVEIINTTRTEAYAAGLSWFKPVYNCTLLPALLGEATYVSPAADNAPWYDPDDPISNEFFGFYPLSVTGLEDSTRSSDVIESTMDGGIPGRLREGTKTAVFLGVLIASSPRGAEYGFRWLDRATKLKPCLPALPNFNGNTLHYLSNDPSDAVGCDQAGPLFAGIDGGYFTDGVDMSVDDPVIDGGGPSGTGTLVFDGGTPAETGGVLFTPTPPFVAPEAYTPPLSSYKRFLRRFKINNGPRILSKRTTSDGGAAWNVQMTGVAGTPWEFGESVPILVDFNGVGVADPYAPGITGGVFDQVGEVYIDTLCPEPVWAPIYNPFCPPISSPPTVPIIDSECFPVPDNWWRRRASIPRSYIPLWGDAAPVVSITAPAAEDMTTLRMRFYADLSNSGIPDDNPCAYVGDYVINYVPAGMTLVFDAVAEAIYVIDTAGTQRRADSLVAKSDGTPFDWPQLSCGYGYIVTFDQLDDTSPTPVIDLALVPRAS